LENLGCRGEPRTRKVGSIEQQRRGIVRLVGLAGWPPAERMKAHHG